MTGSDPTLWTATEQAAAIKDRRLGSEELLELCLDRIDHVDPRVHAVCTLDLHRARIRAQAADEATMRGESWGALHGLPITIKDAIATEGIRSTGGAVELTDHVPAADAPVVARLRGAGAIVFGKTNLPRWSGDVQTYNELFGTTNNPHDTSRVPGSSSGGAAAAVAMGFTSFEIGTDIGGSVRIPSHFCGVFGLKPSFGVVPQRGYLDRVGGGVTDADINVFGPIARSAADLELLMSVIAGPPPEDEIGWRIDLPQSTITEPRGLRVGLWLDDPACAIDHEYRALLERTATALADAGAAVVDEHPAVDFAEHNAMFLTMITEAMRAAPDPAGGGRTHLEWLQIDDARALLRRRWAEWFASFDVLLCPVTPTPPFAHHQSPNVFAETTTINGRERPYIDHVGWTGLIGVLGLPSAVAPVGRTAGGLPVGVQVVAPHLRDLDAVAVAGLIGTYHPPAAALALNRGDRVPG